MTGIIYKVFAYQENSKLLYVLTNRGKITLVSKGSQKINSKDRVLSQYLNLIEFKEKENKAMFSLMDAELLNEFLEIKDDFFKLKKISLMLEIVDKIDVQEKENLIYYHLLKSLSHDNINILSLSFMVKILAIMGYKPNLKANGGQINGFSISYGRLVYNNEDIRVDLDVKNVVSLLKALHYDYESELIEISDDDYDVLIEFIKKYYEYHLDIKLKNG